MTLKAAIDELLKRGVDDWVHDGEVGEFARSFAGAATPEQERLVSLRLVAEALRRDLMEIGDLSGEGGRFRKWDMPDDEALQHADRGWRSLGQTPEVGEVFWLRNTPEGDRRGRRLLSRSK
jgi:hypothetical protein